MTVQYTQKVWLLIVSADISQSWHEDMEHKKRKGKYWRNGVLVPPVHSLQSLIMCHVWEENRVSRVSWYESQYNSYVIISKLLFSYYLSLSTIHRSTSIISFFSLSHNFNVMYSLAHKQQHTNPTLQKAIWQYAFVLVLFFTVRREMWDSHYLSSNLAEFCHSLITTVHARMWGEKNLSPYFPPPPLWPHIYSIKTHWSLKQWLPFN